MATEPTAGPATSNAGKPRVGRPNTEKTPATERAADASARAAEAHAETMETMSALSALSLKVANSYLAVADSHAEMISASYKAKIATCLTFEKMRQCLLEQALEADAETLELISARLSVISAVMG